MKFFIAISIFLLAAGSGYTQQLHFAYLQTDSHKPFYVSLNKKNYSSTASGYIILPKLQNGEYPVRIGFAKSEVAEQEFVLQVTDNDQGFLIKDFGDKGWGLFNLQTMAVQYAVAAAQERAKLAAAEKRAEEARQQKLREEMLAAEKQRQEDSLKKVAVIQQHFADSAAAASVANTRLQNYQDSVARANTIARQNQYKDSIAIINKVTQQKNYADSVAGAKVIMAENERLEKIADSTARALAEAAEKQKEKNALAVKAESERLRQIADSTANVQAAAIEKQKEKPAIVVKPDTNKPQIPRPDTVPSYVALPDTQHPVLLQQKFTDSGWHYAYRVTNPSGRETVNAFIPSAQPKLPVAAILPDAQKDTIAVIIQPSVTDSSKSLNINVGMDTVVSLQKPSTDTVPQNITPIIVANAGNNQGIDKDTTTQPAEKSILNSNCKALADEKDFFNIRKKIASAIGTEQMLVAARKQLKEKCYTTEQLRNLSVLFLTDAGRYQFLDAAYPFAFDAYRYNTLQDLFIDPYYVQRFKAMLR